MVMNVSGISANGGVNICLFVSLIRHRPHDEIDHDHQVDDSENDD